MKARRDASVRSLKLMIAACIVLPVALFCYAAWQNWETIFSHADESIDQSLDIVAENALKIFQSISVTLTSVEQIAGASGSQVNEAELHDRFKQMASVIPDIESIWAFDAKGHPLASSAVFPVPSQLDNSDRKYFSSQRPPAAPMFIGDVLQPKISKFPFFPVSARRTDSKGNFIGIAEVAVLPKAFESFFEHLASTTSASFALIRDDGVVLARYPLADRPNIQLDASTGFGKLIAQNPQGGRYTTVSGVDKIERRFAVKKLEGYPLYVSSSLEISSIRSDWIKLMETHLIFGIPATLLLVTLAVFTLLRTKEFYAEAERREAAELTLRQSQKMDAVGQLTGGVSHDFNNLLTIITGNLQLALRDVTDGRLQRRLTAALAGADRAAQLTRKLLAFARNQPLDPKPLDVNQLVNGMSEMLTRTLGENISIETVGSAGLWQTEVDSSELESAILNLAINARDAIKDGGKLTIETANTFLDENYCRDFDDIKPGQYVLISVSDTGAGMPKEVADRAFDPFFTTKAPGVGTGLGLSQVYGFVRQSGGHIRIYSELNLGTTVKIYLPRSMKTAPAPTVEEERAPQGSQELILVVEDDAAVRSYVVEALADLNYKVVQAENAEKALVVLEASKPVQLMLTDVVMPGLNGRALADAARGLQPGLKVLFMTGYSRNAIVHHGRLDPGVALIQKPFSQATLATRIRGVLDS